MTPIQCIAMSSGAFSGSIRYTTLPSGRRLLNLYEQVAASDRTAQPQPIEHGERVLDAFLDVARFRPIRS